MSSTHAHFLGSDKFLMCMLGALGAVFFLLDCVLDKLVLEGALEMLFPQSEFGFLLLQLCPHSQSHQLCPLQKSLLPLGLFLQVSISEHLVLCFPSSHCSYLMTPDLYNTIRVWVIGRNHLCFSLL